MNIRLVKDYWTVEEIAAIVLERTGKSGKVALENGELVLDFVEQLSDHERVDLETYFGADHDLPTVVEKVSKEARQEALVARVRKFTNGNEISMNVKDIREALGAVAELVGIDVKVKKNK